MYVEVEHFKNPKVIGGLVVGCYISNQVIKKVINIIQKNETKKKIKAKREERQLGKDRLEEFLLEKEVRFITDGVNYF